MVDINPAANTADKLSIGAGGLGTLTLEPGSVLTLNFLNSSVKAGQLFDILDFGTDIGTFSSINTIGLGPGFTLDTSRLYTTGQLSVMPEPGTVAIWSLLGLAAIPAARRLTRKKK